ncbi:hypothetical protein SNEBB_009724 [Seison nebaliae]|nr:hypothetical protein SNEBB_009724 [Seison nebaliae]
MLCHKLAKCDLLGIVRGISSSSIYLKNKRAGVPKVTKNRTKPLTYEEANPPHYIGVRKSWNTWNTSTMIDGNRTAETVMEDILIRRFVEGTWHNLFVSQPLIIKRKENIITIVGLIQRSIAPRKIYFLLGYTEKLLTLLLKSPVRMEIQSVEKRQDMIFKYI